MDAIRIYQRLGFQTRYRLITGKSVLTNRTAYSSGGSV